MKFSSNLPNKSVFSSETFFLDCCFVVYFCGPSASNKALNMIPPQFSSWRRVKVYGSVGACKTFPPCVKELSLKQVGVNMCEPFMSLADIYFFFFFFFFPPLPTVAGVWGRIVLSDRFQAWRQPRSHFWHQQLAVIAMTLSQWWEQTGTKSRDLNKERHWRGESWERSGGNQNLLD